MPEQQEFQNWTYLKTSFPTCDYDLTGVKLATNPLLLKFELRSTKIFSDEATAGVMAVYDFRVLFIPPETENEEDAIGYIFLSVAVEFSLSEGDFLKLNERNATYFVQQAKASAATGAVRGLTKVLDMAGIETPIGISPEFVVNAIEDRLKTAQGAHEVVPDFSPPKDQP